MMYSHSEEEKVMKVMKVMVVVTVVSLARLEREITFIVCLLTKKVSLRSSFLHN